MYFEVYRTWTGGNGNCFLSWRIILLEKVGPQIQLGGLWERCKLPQRGLGRSPSRKRFLVHFSPKIRHLVAKIVMTFLRINLPNFMYFEVYRTWTGGDGNCFLGSVGLLFYK